MLIIIRKRNTQEIGPSPDHNEKDKRNIENKGINLKKSNIKKADKKKGPDKIKNTNQEEIAIQANVTTKESMIGILTTIEINLKKEEIRKEITESTYSIYISDFRFDSPPKSD